MSDYFDCRLKLGSDKLSCRSSRWTDHSRWHNHGTPKNGVRLWMIIPGQLWGYRFDGVDDYVEVPDDSSLNITDEITYEAWAKISYVPSDTWCHIIVSKHSDYGNGLYAVYYGRPKQVAFVLYINGHYGTIYSGTGYFDDWHHFVGTYDGEWMRFYIDGVEVGHLQITGSIPTNTQPVRIGGGVNTRYTKGKIDSVRIYNRALSAEEIKEQYYKGLKTHYTEVNKEDYYKSPLYLLKRGIIRK